jgi:predicted double-glycine peptidase
MVTLETRPAKRVIGAILLLLSVLGFSKLQARDQTPTAWLDVPYVQQIKAGCGSAAVAMVVQYWAREYPGRLDAAAADSERIDRLLPPTPKGIQGKALKKFMEAHGFSAFIFDAEVQDLRDHFARGRPMIVCLALNGPNGPLHYAVVVGVDANSVWLNDPARGKLIREPMTRFLPAWKETGNWALLAVPRQSK